MKFSCRVVFFLSAPLVVIYGIFGKQIIRLCFGEPYVSGYFVLIFLSIGFVFKSIYGVVATTMNMSGHQRKVLFTVMGSVFLNVLLNIIFVPTFGMNGAAMSTAVSFILLGLTLRSTAARLL